MSSEDPFIYVIEKDTMVRKELSSQAILGYIMWFQSLRPAMINFSIAYFNIKTIKCIESLHCFQ